MDAYLHPLCPFRPPHWRWLQSWDCVDGPVGPWHYTDGAILEASAFRWRKLWGEDVSHHPIAIALDIRKEVSARRAELEARLLARQTHETIAGTMGIQQAIIEQYALLFFDLPPVGYGEDWILIQIFHVPCAHTRQVTEFENWRWLGWTGGEFVLEVALREYKSGSVTELGTLLRDAMQLACESAASGPLSIWFWEAAARVVKSMQRRKHPECEQLRLHLRMLRLATQPRHKPKPKKKAKQPAVPPESNVTTETTVQPMENHDYGDIATQTIGR